MKTAGIMVFLSSQKCIQPSSSEADRGSFIPFALCMSSCKLNNGPAYIEDETELLPRACDETTSSQCSRPTSIAIWQERQIHEHHRLNMVPPEIPIRPVCQYRDSCPDIRLSRAASALPEMRSRLPAPSEACFHRPSFRGAAIVSSNSEQELASSCLSQRDAAEATTLRQASFISIKPSTFLSPLI